MRGKLLLVSAFFWFFALIFGWFAVTGTQRDSRFESEDVVRADAVVKKILIYHHRRSESYAARMDYSANGFRVTESTTVSPEAFQRLHVNDTVKIKYLANNPFRIRIDAPDEDQFWRQNDYMGACIAGVLAIIAVIVSGVGLTRKR